MAAVDRFIAAWRQTLDAMIALGDELTDTDWKQRTECPEWNVQDVYAHMIGGELWMSAGHPLPERGMAQWADEPVATRRDWAPETVLAELREVYARRLAEIAASPPDPDLTTHTAYGLPVTLGTLWSFRAFDVWVHEQDVRRAVGRPGNLDSPGAHVGKSFFTAQLPRIVAKLAGAPRGSLVRLTATGPVPVDLAVRVGDDGRGSLVPVTDEDQPTAHVATDWETYARLGCGRIAPDTPAVTVDGDRELAHRVLANLTITP
jgi:uncharacterized protein (TIGR03083 family)